MRECVSVRVPAVVAGGGSWVGVLGADGAVLALALACARRGGGRMFCVFMFVYLCICVFVFCVLFCQIL